MSNCGVKDNIAHFSLKINFLIIKIILLKLSFVFALKTPNDWTVEIV